MTLSHHLTGVVLGVVLFATSALAQAPPPLPATEAAAATPYLVFFRSQPIGREEVAVVRQAEGWIVRGSSRQGPPIDITTRVAEVIYDTEWRPKSMLIDGVVRGQDVTMKTTFADGKASNVIAVQGTPQSKVDAVSADTIVLPNAFLGSYAVLARRLAGQAVGAELHAYIAPQVEVPIRVTAITPQRIDTAKASINATQYAIAIVNPAPAGELPMFVWVDKNGDLLRMSIPSQTLEMAREDIASAAARTATFIVPGDEAVIIPASGFNIAATITKPAGATGRLPALVLIGGSGPTDRDETVAGIPVFGQIARDLVAAGFFVVRYDKRGVGQSGGRMESVTLNDYAEDARAVVRWLRDRKDVNKKQIGIIGHSEGASVALVVAARERDNVAALASLAGLAGTGAALVLEQQQHLLGLMKITDADKAEKTALQVQINNALLGVGKWDGVPDTVRRVADTPWFQSFLSFDASKAMKDVRQPILIVQGELDMQVMAHHADELAALARARKNKAAVEVIKVPGVNHLFVPAKTGEVAEYPTLTSNAKVSAAMTTAVAEWMKKTMTK
ncbi:MAG: alpha/beta fold hydrolase [Vicinamibacterales bacterium]